MTQRPAESTISSDGNWIFETRYFDDSANASFSDYSQVLRTSTYGDELDLWGATEANPWVPEDINSPEFGVEFEFTPSNATGAHVTVHGIRVTVCYELANSKGTVSNQIGSGLMGVTRDGPLDVVVGVEGRIFTSDDAGQTWTQRSSPTTQDLWAVAYRSYTSFRGYIAVGKNGAVVSSTDGITWALESVGSGQDFYEVFVGEKVLLGGTNAELLIGDDLASLEFGVAERDNYVDPSL
jgi:photosystem II stability/assembly factor-like uncharacterized protein